MANTSTNAETVAVNLLVLLQSLDYLPGGSMFEVSTFPGMDGLLRESFTMSGDEMTSYAGGYEHCIDTNPIVETYVVEGDSIADDDEAGSMTRIPTSYQD